MMLKKFWNVFKKLKMKLGCSEDEPFGVEVDKNAAKTFRKKMGFKPGPLPPKTREMPLATTPNKSVKV